MADLALKVDEIGQRMEENLLRPTMRLQEKLAADAPWATQAHVNLGANYHAFGLIVRDDGRPNASLEWFGKAVGTLTDAHAKDPQSDAARLALRNSHRERATVYGLLRMDTEGAKDWDMAVELSPPAEQPALRALRASSRVRTRQVAEAVAEVAELTQAGTWSAGQWYDFACVYAVASDKDASKRDEYAARAIELLRKAVEAGYTNAAHMAADADLAPLRGRADYRKLFAELEAKYPRPPEAAPPPRPVR